jgi:hypothetical protein
MTRRYLAWAVGALLIPFAGTGTALADGTGQVIGQSNTSSQQADADATSTQHGASNRNIVVRVLSPGDDGDVTQSNSSKATSDATNTNTTGQSATQNAVGGALQEIGQANGNRQSASADATSEQFKPSNDNIAVRVLSPGGGGDVTQSNSSEATSNAGNANTTTQSAEQNAGGDCRCKHGDVLQVIGQANHNDQRAESDATSKQVKPSNSNIAVRVLSPGKDGDVSQSNSSEATSESGNANATEQRAAQRVGGVAAPLERELERCGCKGGDVIQAIGQANGSSQQAHADATSTQKGAENLNVPVRVLSPGHGGSVEQSNSSAADANAGNRNATSQSATQQAGGARCGCRHGDLVIQAIGQENGNRQAADADATSEQWWPSNANAPLSIGGGHGHGMPAPAAELLERIVRPAGSVKQANDSQAGSKAGSENTTRQGASQDA